LHCNPPQSFISTKIFCANAPNGSNPSPFREFREFRDENLCELCVLSRQVPVLIAVFRSVFFQGKSRQFKPDQGRDPN
jgi:hypothetical protein